MNEIVSNLYSYLMDLNIKYDNFIEMLDIINFPFEIAFMSHNLLKIIHYCDGYKFTIRLIKSVNCDVQISCRKVYDFE